MWTSCMFGSSLWASEWCAIIMTAIQLGCLLWFCKYRSFWCILSTVFENEGSCQHQRFLAMQTWLQEGWTRAVLQESWWALWHFPQDSEWIDGGSIYHNKRTWNRATKDLRSNFFRSRQDALPILLTFCPLQRPPLPNLLPRIRRDITCSLQEKKKKEISNFYWAALQAL